VTLGLILKATIDPSADGALVERPAPGAAPTAFRIWAAGKNECDGGSIEFSEASAKALVEEQAARGRLYSIDFDHLSLMPDRPAESGRAAGWHSLEVRRDAAGAPELWAINVDWCADARAGLEEKPPRWRYFSPAFRTNKDGEVTSYINLALCINPLTHQLPSLASSTALSGETTIMNKKALLAALATITNADASTEDKDKAMAALKAYADAPDDDKEKSADGDDAPPSSKEQPKEGGDAPGDKDDGDGEEKKADDGDKDEKKAATAADPAVKMASALVDANKRIDRLEIEQLLEKRPELPAAVKAWALSQPKDVVIGFLKAQPKKMAEREEKPTPGAGQNERPGLAGTELDFVNRSMGVTAHAERAPQRLEDGSLQIPVMRPGDWRKYEASRQAAPGAGKSAGKGEV
jgi:phage I-like protein